MVTRSAGQTQRFEIQTKDTEAYTSTATSTATRSLSNLRCQAIRPGCTYRLVCAGSKNRSARASAARLRCRFTTLRLTSAGPQTIRHTDIKAEGWRLDARGACTVRSRGDAQKKAFTDRDIRSHDENVAHILQGLPSQAMRHRVGCKSTQEQEKPPFIVHPGASRGLLFDLTGSPFAQAIIDLIVGQQCFTDTESEAFPARSYDCHSKKAAFCSSVPHFLRRALDQGFLGDA